MEVVRFGVKGVTLSLRCHKIKHITNWFNFINAVRRTKNKLKNTVILSAYGKIKGKNIWQEDRTRKTGERCYCTTSFVPWLGAKLAQGSFQEEFKQKGVKEYEIYLLLSEVRCFLLLSYFKKCTYGHYKLLKNTFINHYMICTNVDRSLWGNGRLQE